MKNIFLDFPEFIDQDVRKNRPFGERAYRVTTEFQYQRHSILLPESFVKDLTVLDLGSCIGATGAWVLKAGAKSYTGVELQPNFVSISQNLLQRYFQNQNWKILPQSFTEFFKSNSKKYDVVVSFGSIYHSTEVEKYVNWLVSVANKYIIIDSIIPPFQKLWRNHNLAVTQYVDSSMVNDEGYLTAISSGIPNLLALKIMLDQLGFQLIHDHTELIQNLFPNNQGRYYAVFKKTTRAQISLPDTETALANPDLTYSIPFDALSDPTFPAAFNPLNKGWRFNQVVAKDFNNHARKHIPDYDIVIDKCIKLCRSYLSEPETDRILDVGCAIGETIKRLNNSGFYNLVGVDASKDMLAEVDQLPIAHWIHSKEFPGDQGPYHAILCNWTLHFIKEKTQYLSEIFNCLLPGGFLILTDKTNNSGIDLELYHNFKRQQGVSEDEIQKKANDIKDIMFIDDNNWYQQTLKELGFQDIAIVHQVPCFTTFVAFKK
jgi:tRNA (cmo5U34)-methyltransferase